MCALIPDFVKSSFGDSWGTLIIDHILDKTVLMFRFLGVIIVCGHVEEWLYFYEIHD